MGDETLSNLLTFAAGFRFILSVLWLPAMAVYLISANPDWSARQTFRPFVRTTDLAHASK